MSVRYCNGCPYAQFAKDGGYKCRHPNALNKKAFLGKTHPKACPLKNFSADDIEDWLPQATAKRQESQHSSYLHDILELCKKQKGTQEEIKEARDSAFSSLVDGSIGWGIGKFGSLLCPLIGAKFTIPAEFISRANVGFTLLQSCCILAIIILFIKKAHHIHLLQRQDEIDDAKILDLMEKSNISWAQVQNETKRQKECLENVRVLKETVPH